MIKRFSLLLSMLLAVLPALADHNRAGEITFRRISGNTYEITLVTYTFTGTDHARRVDESRDSLLVDWSDGSTSMIPRISESYLISNDYKRNVYKGTHTFPGTGIYRIVMEDPMRNQGVKNIPGNSNDVEFTLETYLNNAHLSIDNQSPVLLYPPLDWAVRGQKFVHNPAAYDPDGDSLSYELAYCLGFDGKVIDGYSLPAYSNEFYVDEITGDLVWDAPTEEGIYNLAMYIHEWRDGKKISTILRDLQVEVEESENEAPELDLNDAYCVVVDDLLEFPVSGTDANGDILTLSAYGGPLELDTMPARFDRTVHGEGQVSNSFSWQTHCSHVRSAPYQVLFSLTDEERPYKHGEANKYIRLTDLKTVNIRVIAPPVENVAAQNQEDNVLLDWNIHDCPNAASYLVYRREGFSGFVPDSCQTGVPEETGYQVIESIEGYTSTGYLDNNHNHGLLQGKTYCYIITALFPDGAESMASEEVCVDIPLGDVLFTKISVEETSAGQGQMRVQWIPPGAQEQQANPGAVNYRLNHNEGMTAMEYSEVVRKTSFYDTAHVHTGINSLDSGHSYQLELIYEGSPYGIASRASSVYLQAERKGTGVRLSTEHYVPWLNERYVFLKKEGNGLWDTLGTSTSPVYEDTVLNNYTTYCYKVKTEGRYDSVPEVPYMLENWSQETCVEIVDSTAPTPLEIEATAYCGNNYNLVSWRRVQDSELEDVAGYVLYYAARRGQDPEELRRFDDVNDTSYTHEIGDNQAGCYYYRVYDLYGNQGELSKAACVEGCFTYDLPNIFTPNGDGHNDIFRPVRMENIEKAQIIIFNRWGNTIYETTDPQINWDGTIQRSGRKVSEGTYYYVADIWEKTLDGTKQRSIPGFITVIYGEEAPQSNNGGTE